MSSIQEYNIPIPCSKELIERYQLNDKKKEYISITYPPKGKEWGASGLISHTNVYTKQKDTRFKQGEVFSYIPLCI